MRTDRSADRLAAAQVEWRAAEERLYPLAMVDPEGYRQALELVGLLLEALRADDGPGRSARLLELADSPETLLAALPERPRRVPDATLLGAALALRAREVVAADAADIRADLIAAARAEGRVWVCLDGPTELAELVSGGRVELHLPSGVTLVAGIDPWSGDEPFLVEAVPAGGGERVADRFRDRDAWRARYERLRHDVSTLTEETRTISDSG